MFLHFGIYHIANNMLVLFVLGQRLEPVVGKIKFILIYLLGGLGGNIFSFIMEMKSADYAVSAGASGAVFAVMGAMLYVVIRNHGRIQDISVRQMMIMAGFSLYFGFTSTGVDNAAHVGGMVCGFILAAVLYHPGNFLAEQCGGCFPIGFNFCINVSAVSWMISLVIASPVRFHPL